MDKVKVISIVENQNNTLFGTDSTRYVVPVYQRPFAWGSENKDSRPNEILQLVEDVLSASGDYYLGSLVVAKSRDENFDFEVIDGQQRLTALYIILACLGYHVKCGSLGYACRDVSKKLIEDLAKVADKNVVALCGDKKKDDENSGIRAGIRTVLRWLRENADRVRGLKLKFEAVKLFRIEVPEGTDLNRYFEIMNTRGEQLEQQDIVKAALMDKLPSISQRMAFAEAWDACGDMNGYVQMHFSGERMTGRKSRREEIFDDWTKPPLIDQLEISDSGADEQLRSDVDSDSFNDLVDIDPDVREVEDDGETYKNARFESILDYPHFLLHVLHVFNGVEKIGANLLDQTDSAKLQSEFAKVFPRECEGKRVLHFMTCLLTCRYNFDKYILKREFGSVKDVGVWSLKELARSKSKGKFSAYYKNTLNIRDVDFERHEELLKIEACLRVSYTNPKVMHWITNLLTWLYNNNENGQCKMEGLLEEARGIARAEAKKFIQGGNFNQGVLTPNVVLNYLDYLLWLNRGDLSKRPGYEHLGNDFPFDFEFRDSVEHWYPQHPDMEGEGCAEWSTIDNQHGVVDRFGNLALLPSNVNAHFSNQPPAGKCGYEAKICGGSLKLRVMAQLTENPSCQGCQDRNLQWRNVECERHETEMLEILRQDCGLP